MCQPLRLRSRRHGRPGFTLVEILVVLAIIMLVSLIALPAVYSSLAGRQITDAARIFTGGLVGIRDSAIRYNEPRGIRLIPDPVLTIPPPGSIGAGTMQLVYNRFIAIEPAGDYSEGRIAIGPMTPATATFPPVYPHGSTATVYPFPDPNVVTPTAKVLMVEESPYVGGFVLAGAPKSTPQPNSPTSWYWNVRVGDKLKIGATGRAYTVVGPCTLNPWTDNGFGIGNTELFVNVGPPGTASPLTRSYYYKDGTLALRGQHPEFLFVVNGEDDDLDGYVDNGWDNFNNDSDLMADGVTSNVDEVDEWEAEKWVGSTAKNVITDPTATTDSPSSTWIANSYQSGTHDAPYIIQRRPVPSQGAREVMLPSGMVIDATTWNSTRERSRIPVSAGSLYCDVMVNPNGLYIPTTEYSSPTSAPASPFLHFWLTSREDVHPRGSVWGLTSTGASVPNPSNVPGRTFFEHPLPGDALGGILDGAVLTPTSDGQYYPGTSKSVPVLKADRRLVTMSTQSGLVVTNTTETIPPTSDYQPGEGFYIWNINYPYLKAQQGLREVR